MSIKRERGLLDPDDIDAGPRSRTQEATSNAMGNAYAQSSGFARVSSQSQQNNKSSHLHAARKESSKRKRRRVDSKRHNKHKHSGHSREVGKKSLRQQWMSLLRQRPPDEEADKVSEWLMKVMGVSEKQRRASLAKKESRSRRNRLVAYAANAPHSDDSSSNDLESQKSSSLAYSSNEASTSDDSSSSSSQLSNYEKKGKRYHHMKSGDHDSNSKKMKSDYSSEAS